MNGVVVMDENSSLFWEFQRAKEEFHLIISMNADSLEVCDKSSMIHLSGKNLLSYQGTVCILNARFDNGGEIWKKTPSKE